MSYPPCPMTERYPALLEIPPSERQRVFDQAEAGKTLTETQAVALGISPTLASRGLVLLPAQGSWTEAQYEVVFPASRRHALAQALMKSEEQFNVAG